MQSKILGIDPGYERVGFAVIENKKGRLNLLHSECFETGANLPHPERLALIAKRLEEILTEYKPTTVAVEELLFSKNVKTAMKVAEARGVILAESAKKKIAIREYNPNSIKLAVTGYGKSDKRQVIAMVERLVKISHTIKYDDEYDAIAVALTSAAHSY